MLKKTLAALMLAATAGAASAAITLSGGTFNGAIAGYNPVPLSTATFTTGLIDPFLFSTGGTLTVTYLGKEANDTNEFVVAGLNSVLELFNTSAPGATGSALIEAGAVPFGFLDTTANVSVVNGGNPGDSLFGSYAVFGTQNGSVFTPATTANGRVYDLIIGFNDGLRVDADFDDMVIGITVSAIPEPETYALMLGGLGLVGFMARRRQQATRA